MLASLLTYTKQNVHLESYWMQQNILTKSQRKEQTTGVKGGKIDFVYFLTVPGITAKRKEEL